MMIKMPHFEEIVLSIHNNKKYRMIPITDEEYAKLQNMFKAKIEKEAADTDGSFYIKLMDYRIYDSDIILFGKSLEDSEKVAKVLENVVYSNSILTTPSRINLINLTMSDKITPGVTPYRHFIYYVGLIGNPKNILIFQQ